MFVNRIPVSEVVPNWENRMELGMSYASKATMKINFQGHSNTKIVGGGARFAKMLTTMAGRRINFE